MIASKKKSVEIEVNGFRQVWRNGIKGSCDVDVYNEAGDLVLEWSYPRLGSLTNTVVVFSEQANLQASK